MYAVSLSFYESIIISRAHFFTERSLWVEFMALLMVLAVFMYLDYHIITAGEIVPGPYKLHQTVHIY